MVSHLPFYCTRLTSDLYLWSLISEKKQLGYNTAVHIEPGSSLSVVLLLYVAYARLCPLALLVAVTAVVAVVDEGATQEAVPSRWQVMAGHRSLSAASECSTWNRSILLVERAAASLRQVCTENFVYGTFMYARPCQACASCQARIEPLHVRCVGATYVHVFMYQHLS